MQCMPSARYPCILQQDGKLMNDSIKGRSACSTPDTLAYCPKQAVASSRNMCDSDGAVSVLRYLVWSCCWGSGVAYFWVEGANSPVPCSSCPPRPTRWRPVQSPAPASLSKSPAGPVLHHPRPLSTQTCTWSNPLLSVLH